MRKVKERYAHLIFPKKMVHITLEDRENDNLKELSCADCKKTKRAMKNERFYNGLYNQIGWMGTLITAVMGMLDFCYYDRIDQKKIIPCIVSMAIVGVFCDYKKSFYNKRETSLKRMLIRKREIRDHLYSDALGDILIQF